MTLRGNAAITGIGELPTRRSYPGRSMESLCAEAARIAIADAGLQKEQVDGLVVEGGSTTPASTVDRQDGSAKRIVAPPVASSVPSDAASGGRFGCPSVCAK